MKTISILMAGEGDQGNSGNTGDQGSKGTTGGTGDQGQKSIIDDQGKAKPEAKSIIGDTEGQSGDEKGVKPEGEKGATDLKLKLPEGMDEKAAEPHLAIFKKHGLKSEAAQEIFDHVLKHASDSRSAFEKEISSNWANTQKQWLEQAQKDPEIGGEKFKASVAAADRFVMRFGGAELAEVMIKSGLGRNVTVLKALAKAGAAITEDSIHGTVETGGKGGEPSEKDRLKAEFPNSPSLWQHLPD